MAWTYAKIRKLRALLLEELNRQVTSLTVEHHRLIEDRIANIIAAGLDDAAVEAEKADFNL